MHYPKLLLFIIGTLCFGCEEEKNGLAQSNVIFFDDPKSVTIQGYDGHAMEPFVSRDGKFLFFNNLNAPTVNTNLHWCTKVNDTLFQYRGELSGINSESLEGVPTMDKNYNFYFVYTGSYQQTLSTIYQGKYASGIVQIPEIVENISKKIPGWVNFDIEVSNDGNTLYFVDGRFDGNGKVLESNLVIAKKGENNQFFRSADSDNMLQNINSVDLEYAAAITKDELEICFTRVTAPLNNDSEPKIFIASRKSREDPFSNVHQIENLTGFVEAATYADNDQGIYFHKKEEGNHKLYFTSKL